MNQATKKGHALNTPAGQFAVAVFSGALAAASAFSMLGEVRLVHILVLFFGGFGAGAGLVNAIHQWRAARRPPAAEANAPRLAVAQDAIPADPADGAKRD